LSLADLDNITAVAKHKLKKATLKIIEMIRVYHMTEKINRHDSCDSDITRILKAWKDPTVSYRESEDSYSDEIGQSEKSLAGSRHIRLKREISPPRSARSRGGSRAGSRPESAISKHNVTEF
jgi:hypothetical protein